MSAAVVRATPLRSPEAIIFWSEFSEQCNRQTAELNAVLNDHGLTPGDQVQICFEPDRAVLTRRSLPSTEISLKVKFEDWGPKISGAVRGQQDDQLHFYPEDFELIISKDQHNGLVAMTPEGRGLSPFECAKFVLQYFRRSYSGVTLPCPEAS